MVRLLTISNLVFRFSDLFNYLFVCYVERVDVLRGLETELVVKGLGYLIKNLINTAGGVNVDPPFFEQLELRNFSVAVVDSSEELPAGGLKLIST